MGEGWLVWGHWGRSDLRKEDDTIGLRGLLAPGKVVVVGPALWVLERGPFVSWPKVPMHLLRAWSCRCGATARRAWSAGRYSLPPLGPGQGLASPCFCPHRGSPVSTALIVVQPCWVGRRCQDTWGCWGVAG